MIFLYPLNNMGTPGEVRKDVLNRCEVFSKDGGFVFAPIHNILSEVPPQNIAAAYDAVKEFNGKTPEGPLNQVTGFWFPVSGSHPGSRFLIAV